MERELKLELQQDQADALLALPLVAACCVEPPHEALLVSTYFDTPGLHLRQHGVSLRVRRAGAHFVQTLKTHGTSQAGLYAREEFESAVSSDRPDLELLRPLVPEATELGMMIREGDLADQLQPVFVTDVQRTVALLRLPQGGEVELALDRGIVQAGNATAPIRELEMEIQAGDTAHLYAFALQLLALIPMRLSRVSKADRGYELMAGARLEVARARPLRLGQRDTVEAAFQAIARNCLAQICGNERGVMIGDVPESVHQMRVGLRRLRSALDLFSPSIGRPCGLEAEISWIAEELGPARDWEVLANATLPAVLEGAPEDLLADPLRAAAAAMAGEKRRHAAQAVDSERYTRLVLELGRWLESAGWRQGLDEAQCASLTGSAIDFALARLHERHRRLLQRGRGLAGLDPRRLHRARIAAKKLRYATEFFGPLYPQKRTRRYRGTLARLQDDLGWRNDMTVADGLLGRLQKEQQEACAGASYARGYIAALVSADKEALRRIWKRFKAISLPL
ncbi:CHAD domain-containing protein [Cupriavidus sp. CV2]|uniref:CYTH and CHAD domain-containing protein n=1 Tax=Cupriavidus ulmosensis TaxID=3065913 RepID=UPI00296A9EE3|nr:CHAD domain-containing protein [Cupriavidus sp. CV2]MDW3684660.1 CHAD domain-containing protein [Cupriavidus sp. CV2]